jgi:hypothetical protein
MSQMVMMGNDIAYGVPVSGLRDDGPVLPKHDPSRFVHMTWNCRSERERGLQ